MNRTMSSLLGGIAGVLLSVVTATAAVPNAFYAMDTSFDRPGLTLEQQLDLVKQLGYAGIAWHEQSSEEVNATVAAVEKRGLTMFTIYCPATVTSEGDLEHSPGLLDLIKSLKGHGTIIWLHIGGNGPAFDSLTGKEPVVQKLRALADVAKANDLRIAIYPHLGEWTAKFGDATRLAKVVKHPNFGVTFNLCHCMGTGDEAKIPTLLDDSKDVLTNVTICGADSGVTGDRWAQLIQTLDKGSYDVGIVLRKLTEIGFTGPIGFQGYGIEGNSRSILEPTMQGWKKLTAEQK
jgi:sugar phosphate isomerase/epimerase